MQRAIDNAYGNEQDHWEDSLFGFGLDLYLRQLIKRVEYEVFGKVYQVDILNESST